MPPARRTVADIDRDLSAAGNRRDATKAAIRRRREDIARAETDVLSYERQLEQVGATIEGLLDERARVAWTPDDATIAEIDACEPKTEDA